MEDPVTNMADNDGQTATFVPKIYSKSTNSLHSVTARKEAGALKFLFSAAGAL